MKRDSYQGMPSGVPPTAVEYAGFSPWGKNRGTDGTDRNFSAGKLGELPVWPIF
jgi:hypothetical protein